MTGRRRLNRKGVRKGEGGGKEGDEGSRGMREGEG